MTKADITIVPYSKEYKEYIKTLNYEWLEKYFFVETSDVEQLSDPQFHIIDKGGHIYFAKYRNDIVGTSSLIKINSEVYELAKMAVTEKYKGLGIGKILLEYCIEKAQELGAVKLILYSNTKLLSAIHLYKKYGFKEVAMPEHAHYERADVMMEQYL
ncbi:MAG: GNAT family N-acetyltransferase [Ferruginibacter sp.]|nr:GNAT family N-acetyltransferase [Ferruginibacter sp.]